MRPLECRYCAVWRHLGAGTWRAIGAPLSPCCCFSAPQLMFPNKISQKRTMRAEIATLPEPVELSFRFDRTRGER